MIDQPLNLNWPERKKKHGIPREYFGMHGLKYDTYSLRQKI